MHWWISDSSRNRHHFPPIRAKERKNPQIASRERTVPLIWLPTKRKKKPKKVLILILYVSNYNPRGGKCGKGFLKDINVYLKIVIYVVLFINMNISYPLWKVRMKREMQLLYKMCVRAIDHRRPNDKKIRFDFYHHSRRSKWKWWLQPCKDSPTRACNPSKRPTPSPHASQMFSTIIQSKSVCRNPTVIKRKLPLCV